MPYGVQKMRYIFSRRLNKAEENLILEARPRGKYQHHPLAASDLWPLFPARVMPRDAA